MSIYLSVRYFKNAHVACSAFRKKKNELKTQNKNKQNEKEKKNHLNQKSIIQIKRNYDEIPPTKE